MLKSHYFSMLKSLLEQILFGQTVSAVVYMGGNFTESSIKFVKTLAEFDANYLNHLPKTGRNIWSENKTHNNLRREKRNPWREKINWDILQPHATYNPVSHISIVFKITVKLITNNSLAITLH